MTVKDAENSGVSVSTLVVALLTGWTLEQCEIYRNCSQWSTAEMLHQSAAAVCL
jgi:hypothetical protein